MGILTSQEKQSAAEAEAKAEAEAASQRTRSENSGAVGQEAQPMAEAH